MAAQDVQDPATALFARELTMILSGETEAGSAGMQPCRGIAWRAHRDDVRGARKFIFRALPETYRIGRPLCLENPRPEGAEYLLPESAPSPFHAEPTQREAGLPESLGLNVDNFVAVGSLRLQQGSTSFNC